MRRLRALIERVAPTRLPVWIEGPTGTGKELVAMALHEQSRRTGALVSFNVCALADSMFEDALFGHARGAYTGALNESTGFLREANGGTVFLDEITGLPLAMQVKLLRAVETGVFRPIGASRDACSDFRTIVATNDRVDQMVSEGRFRADLAHRLRGMVLTAPPLTDRIEDIPLLVDHFVRRARGGEPLPVTAHAIKLLAEQDWPGNVRELKQVIEAALVFARGAIDADALESVLANRSRSIVCPQTPTTLESRDTLIALLDRESWNTQAVAMLLGTHRATVYRRMKRLGIVAPLRRESLSPFAALSQ